MEDIKSRRPVNAADSRSEAGEDYRNAHDASRPSGGSGSEYHCIDTRIMDRCIEKKDSFIARYDKIVTDYDKIVADLSGNWVGEGACAFIEDARVVRTNITGIADILANMVNVLVDIRAVVGEVDHQLGDMNRNPEGE